MSRKWCSEEGFDLGDEFGSQRCVDVVVRSCFVCFVWFGWVGEILEYDRDLFSHHVKNFLTISRE